MFSEHHLGIFVFFSAWENEFKHINFFKLEASTLVLVAGQAWKFSTWTAVG